MLTHPASPSQAAAELARLRRQVRWARFLVGLMAAAGVMAMAGLVTSSASVFAYGAAVYAVAVLSSLGHAAGVALTDRRF